MRIRAALFLLAMAACTRPSTDECRKAILNVQHLRGLDASAQAPNVEPAVRRCRSTAKVDTVKCLIAARTADELNRCEPGEHK